MPATKLYTPSSPLSYAGEVNTVGQWARISGLPVGLLLDRLNAGVRGDEVFAPGPPPDPDEERRR